MVENIRFLIVGGKVSERYWLEMYLEERGEIKDFEKHLKFNFFYTFPFGNVF